MPIGTGTSGKVYAGTTDGSGVAVAIKVIDRMEIDGRPDKIKQLTRELNITRKLKHPNIINLLDVVFDEMRAMLIMEMADESRRASHHRTQELEASLADVTAGLA